jgi:hypothetical protein
MSDAREQLTSEALSAADLKFLEAVKRTQQETTIPPEMNVDVGAIAKKAFATYLEGLEKPQVPDAAVVNGRALSHAIARLLPEESEDEKVSVQFTRDFFYAVVPTIILIILAVGYFVVRSKVNVSSGNAVKISILLTAAASLAVTAGFLFKREQLFSHLRSLKYSTGSLVGGLAVATVGLLSVYYGLEQKYKWQQSFRETKIETTSRALAEVGFATVGTTDDNLEEKVKRNFVDLETTSVHIVKSEKPEVKVEAQPDNVPTSVVLKIDPYKAKVSSTSSNEPTYEVLTGTVNKVSDDVIEINTVSPGTDQPRKITAQADQLMLNDFPEIKETGLQGQKVKVLFFSKNSQVIKMSLLGPGTESKIIYNADSLGLKKSAAAIY